MYNDASSFLLDFDNYYVIAQGATDFKENETKPKLYLRIFEVKAKSKRVSAGQRLVTK
jgi:hypothetical protein